MGLDAYDGHDVPDDMAQLLTHSADRLPEPTLDDLLDAAVAPSRLRPTMGAFMETVGGEGAVPLRVRGGIPAFTFAPPRVSGAAYQYGYAFARALRTHTGQPANTQIVLESLLASMKLSYHREDTWTGLDRSFKGVVGISQAGPRLVTPPRRPRHERFLVARSIYALLSGATATAPRLLTDAGTRLQAASRAFAAELLAPANAIRERIRDGVDDELLDEIADEFDVAPAVIAHQIENQLRQYAPAV